MTDGETEARRKIPLLCGGSNFHSSLSSFIIYSSHPTHLLSTWHAPSPLLKQTWLLFPWGSSLSHLNPQPPGFPREAPVLPLVVAGAGGGIKGPH
jgi:hypothetical protein